jgi:hypothetical protein
VTAERARVENKGGSTRRLYCTHYDPGGGGVPSYELITGGLPPSGTRFVDGDGNARSDDIASSGIEGVNI